MELFCSKGRERGSSRQIVEGMDEILGSLRGSIGRGSLGHGAAVRKEFDGFSDALGSSFGDIEKLELLDTSSCFRCRYNCKVVDTDLKSIRLFRRFCS